MAPWLTRDSYVPLLVLIAGALTYAGAAGVGRLALRLIRVRTVEPWQTVLGVLLGIELLAGVVFLAGILSVATRGVLVALLVVWWIGGLGVITGTARGIRTGLASLRAAIRDPATAAAFVVVVLSLLAALIVAAAPSTKADEVYYHMLAPARLVHDGALRFYLMPWESAIVPQMGFQLAMSPLYALGFPDAANIVSWAIGATFAWFAYRVVADAGRSRWGMLWSAVVIVGLYTTVWRTTGGSHAFGDLAMSALVVAIFTRVPGDTSRARAAALGVLGSAAAISKLSSAPLAIALVSIELWSDRERMRDALMWSVAPFLVFWAPCIVWTWHASGAPFGPAFAALFPHSVYAGLPMRELMDPGEGLGLPELAVRYSLLLWVGAGAALVSSALAPRQRLLATALVLTQCLLIVFFTNHDVRFLSGMPAGFAIVFAVTASATFASSIAGARAAFALLLIAPWLAPTLYYARLFAPVDLGLETPDAFRTQYVAYYEDFRALDSVLPRNATLLAEPRIPAAYAPRSVVITARDAVGSSPLFQFGESCAARDTEFRSADTVYFTPSAVSYAYRTPGRPPDHAPLCVVKLVPRR